MDKKRCSGCEKNKTLDKFYKLKTKPDGLDYYCKACRNANMAKSKANNKRSCKIDKCNNPHYAKDMCRLHYARFDRNGQLEPLKTIKELDEDKVNARLMIKYKMTFEDYKKRSENGCEICGGFDHRWLQVDHDHKCCPKQYSCGRCVRGVVCGKCNVSIQKYEHEIINEHHPHKEKIRKYLVKYAIMEKY